MPNPTIVKNTDHSGKAIYQGRLARSGITLAGLLAISAVLMLFDQTRILGLALAFPGAGFWPGVATGFDVAWLQLALAVLSLLLFVFAVIAWFGSGNIIAPPIAWIMTIVLALWMGPGPALLPEWLCIAPRGAAQINGAFWQGVLALGFWPLALLGWALLQPRRPVPAPLPASVSRLEPLPISDETLHLTRFALDRALQPVDEFDGFQFIDQFQTAATRYQINQLGYGLALLQARLPGFRGYLHRAQVNLIHKALSHRIWRYWAWENSWGNLDRNPDPVARDNIMYTGFLALQIALFERATGDQGFSAPGALPLQHSDGRVFAYDLPALVHALHRGWDASPYHLMPCEPNWIYPLCNAIGGAAARSVSPHQWNARSRLFRSALLREFTAPNGTILPFRSAHTGIPAPPAGGSVVQAYPALFWNSLFPDLAADQWARARAVSVCNGTLNKKFFWKVDTGDYRRSRAVSYAGFAAAAAEMGDGDARDLALAALDAECPASLDPVWHRPAASVFGHATELLARLNGGGLLKITLDSPINPPGPVLDVEDRDIIVARADRIGHGLDLCLSPATTPCYKRLTFAGFPPTTPIRWTGTTNGTIITDAMGKLELETLLVPKTILRLEPAT